MNDLNRFSFSVFVKFCDNNVDDGNSLFAILS